MKFTFEAILTIDNTDIDVEVKGNLTAGYRGNNANPPEPDEVEITSITDEDGKEYKYDDLTDSQRDMLDEHAIAHIESNDFHNDDLPEDDREFERELPEEEE